MTEHSKADEARKGLIGLGEGQGAGNHWCCHR